LPDYLYQDGSLDPYEYVCNITAWKPLRRQRWKWQNYVKINHRETRYELD